MTISPHYSTFFGQFWHYSASKAYKSFSQIMFRRLCMLVILMPRHKRVRLWSRIIKYIGHQNFQYFGFNINNISFNPLCKFDFNINKFAEKLKINLLVFALDQLDVKMYTKSSIVLLMSYTLCYMVNFLSFPWIFSHNPFVQVMDPICSSSYFQLNSNRLTLRC